MGNQKKTGKQCLGIFVAFPIALICVIFALCSFAQKAESANEPDFRIGPDELISEYANNSLAADNKFKNKTVRLTGYVEDIGRNENIRQLYVQFDSGYTDARVVCFFDRSYENQLIKLSRTSRVTIQGVVVGMEIIYFNNMNMGLIQLINSQIIN